MRAWDRHRGRGPVRTVSRNQIGCFGRSANDRQDKFQPRMAPALSISLQPLHKLLQKLLHAGHPRLEAVIHPASETSLQSLAEAAQVSVALSSAGSCQISFAWFLLTSLRPNTYVVNVHRERDARILRCTTQNVAPYEIYECHHAHCHHGNDPLRC